MHLNVRTKMWEVIVRTVVSCCVYIVYTVFCVDLVLPFHALCVHSKEIGVTRLQGSSLFIQMLTKEHSLRGSFSKGSLYEGVVFQLTLAAAGRHCDLTETLG